LAAAAILNKGLSAERRVGRGKSPGFLFNLTPRPPLGAKETPSHGGYAGAKRSFARRLPEGRFGRIAVVKVAPVNGIAPAFGFQNCPT
jgi:hypothetical protein